MNKATISDFARMCKKYIEGCKGCPLYSFNYEIPGRCRATLQTYPDKANEIILKWCEEHPVVTRQDEFLKMFPNAALIDEIIKICPNEIDILIGIDCGKQSCDTCGKDYWLAEVEENE